MCVCPCVRAWDKIKLLWTRCCSSVGQRFSATAPSPQSFTKPGQIPVRPAECRAAECWVNGAFASKKGKEIPKISMNARVWMTVREDVKKTCVSEGETDGGASLRCISSYACDLSLFHYNVSSRSCITLLKQQKWSSSIFTCTHIWLYIQMNHRTALQN